MDGVGMVGVLLLRRLGVLVVVGGDDGRLVDAATTVLGRRRLLPIGGSGGVGGAGGHHGAAVDSGGEVGDAAKTRLTDSAQAATALQQDGSMDEVLDDVPDALSLQTSGRRVDLRQVAKDGGEGGFARCAVHLNK